MKITPRLDSIIKMIPNNTKVIDVGTDHGYVPVFLVENKICENAIAADVNKGPLNIAKEYIDSRGLTEKIETRLGSGLEVLNINEVDGAVIAGMGGLLIADILEKSKEVASTLSFFVLQPMTASDKLRRYLIENNYKIVEEKLSREGERIYEIILVEHGNMKIEDDIYLQIGKGLFDSEDPLLKVFITKKMDKIKKVIDNLEGSDSNKAKCNVLKEEYDKLKGLRESI